MTNKQFTFWSPWLFQVQERSIPCDIFCAFAWFLFGRTLHSGDLKLQSFIIWANGFYDITTIHSYYPPLVRRYRFKVTLPRMLQPFTCWVISMASLLWNKALLRIQFEATALLLHPLAMLCSVHGMPSASQPPVEANCFTFSSSPPFAGVEVWSASFFLSLESTTSPLSYSILLRYHLTSSISSHLLENTICKVRLLPVLQIASKVHLFLLYHYCGIYDTVTSKEVCGHCVSAQGAWYNKMEYTSMLYNR